MRICTDCNLNLPDEDFDYRGGGRKGLQATCKACSRKRLQDHRKENREFVDAYKLQHGCSICGYNKLPFALHFDHTNPSTKANKGNSRALEMSWSLDRIKEEIAKCTILCANCHAEKTFHCKDYLAVKE